MQGRDHPGPTCFSDTRPLQQSTNSSSVANANNFTAQQEVEVQLASYDYDVDNVRQLDEMLSTVHPYSKLSLVVMTTSQLL